MAMLCFAKSVIKSRWQWVSMDCISQNDFKNATSSPEIQEFLELMWTDSRACGIKLDKRCSEKQRGYLYGKFPRPTQSKR